MMPIFPQTYDLIYELSKLEKLMPSYSKLLMSLSKVIRLTVWNLSSEKHLTATLHGCNLVFGLLVKTFGEQIEFLEKYIDYLDKNSNTYSRSPLDRIYNVVRAEIAVYKTQDLVREHWRQINPYFRKEYAAEALFSKDLTAIMDDFLDNIVDACPDQFLVPLGDNKFNHLIRGRKGEWHHKDDLCAPSIEKAIEKNIVNRWNPPRKRYLYLIAGKDSPEDAQTVCEELRVESMETITLADFEILPSSKNAKIIDLDYEGTTRESIFNFIDAMSKKQVLEIVRQIKENNVSPTADYVKQQINLQRDETQCLAATLAGELLLKEICDTIFVPLDDDEDNDASKKDKCYKSFHILAECFENRGYAGIRYSSTRMKKISKQGTNVVLFDADSALPLLSTFRRFTK